MLSLARRVRSCSLAVVERLQEVKGARLRQARLQHAEAYGAFLANADLRDADLTRANFYKAKGDSAAPMDAELDSLLSQRHWLDRLWWYQREAYVRNSCQEAVDIDTAKLVQLNPAEFRNRKRAMLRDAGLERISEPCTL